MLTYKTDFLFQTFLIVSIYGAQNETYIED